MHITLSSLISHLRWGWLLAALLIAGCGNSAGPDLSPPDGWDRGVAIAPAADVDASPDVVEVHLEARRQRLEIKPGVMTEVWTYNGQLPGPTIRARKGQRLVVKLTNTLPEPTTLHWHGVRVPASMDGTPAAQAAVKPGETFTYEFDLLDAGTYWYHPHVSSSSAQVGAGLYGALVVEDPDEPSFGDELVMVLSDIGIEADGSLTPGDISGWFGDYFGREGDLKLVNGRVYPKVLARIGLPQRWRIINASRSRFYKLQWPKQAWVRIGGDGGLVEKTKIQDFLLLSPGERAEVMWVPSGAPGAVLEMLAHDGNRFHLELPQEPEPLLQLEISKQPAVSSARTLASGPLRTIAPLDISKAATRSLDLMEKSATGGAVLGFNGQTADEAEPLMTKVGTTEVWHLTNSTSYDHPFHLHGYFFQILEIDGVAAPVREWKDTIIVQPGQHIRFAVHFEGRPGMWMFHCHILDHAELGMMGMFHVMP